MSQNYKKYFSLTNNSLLIGNKISISQKIIYINEKDYKIKIVLIICFY